MSNCSECGKPTYSKVNICSRPSCKLKQKRAYKRIKRGWVELPCELCGTLMRNDCTLPVCTTNRDCLAVHSLLLHNAALSLSDLTPIPVNCPCCGKRFNRINREDHLSLDRLYPEKGYVPGNVYWICIRCNRIKNDASLEELEMVVRHLKGLVGHALA